MPICGRGALCPDSWSADDRRTAPMISVNATHVNATHRGRCVAAFVGRGMLLAMGDDLLLDFLRDRDTPCPACSYNLRNLTTNHCPECGHAMALGVRMPERSLKAWATLLIVCCLGAGLGLFAMAAMATMSIEKGIAYAASEIFWSEPAIGLAVTASLGALPMAVVVLAIRRHFVRMRPDTQVVVVVCAVSYVLIVYTVFFI